MPTYRDLVIADGATLYMRLDETSGTIASSQVGGYTGTISGGVQLNQPGALADGNSAMVFNGTTGQITTAQSIPLRTPYTIEGWLKLAASGTVELLSTRAGYPAIDDIRVFCASVNGQLAVTLDYANGTSSQQNISAAIGSVPVSDWCHAVVAVTALNCSIYVNGVLAASQALPATFTGATTPLEISHDQFSGFGNGSIDEVAIYPVALTATQVAEHYAARLWLPFVLTGRPLTQARTKIERSGVARTGAYVPNVVLTIAGVPFSNWILDGSLHLTLASNDDPDRARLTLTPAAADAVGVPLVGMPIAIALGSVSNPIFGGQILRVSVRRRPGYVDEAPFVDLECMDWMRLFDARLVTFEWRSTSANAIIADLVARWLPRGAGFTTFRVEANLPAVTLAVINERPSTVLRRLTTLIRGHFYIDARKDLHVWTGELEPFYTPPTTLRSDLQTLKAFQETTDLSQVRTRVSVEGMRTSAPLGVPALLPGYQPTVPLEDTSIFQPVSDGSPFREIRIGTQNGYLVGATPPRDPALNPIGSTLTQPYTMTASAGFYQLVVADPTVFPVTDCVVRAGALLIHVFPRETPSTPLYIAGPSEYAGGSAPLEVGESVTLYAHGYPLAKHPQAPAEQLGPDPHSEPWRSQPPGQPAVLVVRKDDLFWQVAWQDREQTGDGVYEHFIQDGRYSVDGATTRALAELEQFRQERTTAAWTTDDMNAYPGRRQASEIYGVAAFTTPLVIDSVEIVFPLRYQPPRRQCQGSNIKISRLGDVLVTDQA